MAVGRRRDALIRQREIKGLSRERAAELLQVSVKTIERVEEGGSRLRIGLRPRYARILDVEPALLHAWLFDEDEPGALNGHEVPQWLNHLASLEQGAAQIWAFEPVVVHGLLQTADYAEAVERADPIIKTANDIARRVELRMRRQVVLTHLRLSVVLDESVLRRVAGDGEVMADQLEHLGTVAQQSNITVRVLPFDAGTFASAFGAFKVLAKAGEEPYMACVEDRVGPHYLDRPNELGAHMSLFEHLTDASLPPAESLELIRQTSKELYP